MPTSRRTFLKNLGGAGALVSGLVATDSRAAHPAVVRTLKTNRPPAATDRVRIGLIGAGIIGHHDVDTVRKLPGVELVAVCDLYTGRLERAKEKWGNALFTTRDYRELLARADVDAVLVCVPDHWHQRIAVDAMNAGKHVYCEKPMVHRIEEGQAIIDAQRKTGRVFQVGSQVASSVATLEAKKYLTQGAIGQLTLVEAINNRNDAKGAWQYSVPTDASPQTVDWDRYLGKAPKVPFEANRFFRWRNYKDYGTGVAGDLFVHLLTALHTVTGSVGPNQIYALGALNYWKDGRDAYDLVDAVMQYPQTPAHPAFHFVTRVNLADGGGGGGKTRFIGTEGVIDMGWNEFTLKRFKRPLAPGYGGYDSLETFSAAQQAAFVKQYDAQYPANTREWKYEPDVVFKSPAGYDDRLDHFATFLAGIREGGKIAEDATFGLRAAGPALACNLSAERQGLIRWDADSMKVLKS